MLRHVQRVLLNGLLSLGLMVLEGAIVPPAAAAPCHTISNQAVSNQAVSNQTICIVEIKRSAKYPWEYRVTLSRDGVKQPQEIYNCREKVRVGAAGIAAPFRTEGNIKSGAAEIGEWLCRLVKRN